MTDERSIPLSYAEAVVTMFALAEEYRDTNVNADSTWIYAATLLTGSSSQPVFRSAKHSGIQACTDGIHLCIAGIIAVNRQYYWGEIFN